jgi:energy-coupling factor transporter ATP-binding protein EcfA2
VSALPPRIGPYRVLRLLAQGGMGRVYLAQDMRLGRVVALKMAHAELADRAEARAQFLVEARASARLAHPNVVPVFDVGEHLGAPWAAYEFVEGRTLKQRLREGPLPLAEARRVMTEIASAVEAAHADGIVHRDLKPANVVLGVDGRARVLDFGIARLGVTERGASEDDASEGASERDDGEALEMLGTPSYMAPEQWSRDDGAPADVWALGLLACETFLGTQPLLRRATHEIVAEMTRSEPLPMPPGFDELPGALQSLVRSCLQKDPARRPSAAEVAASLRGLGSDVVASHARELDVDAFRARARALSALEERARSGGWTLVVGPSGAGKSALARAFATKWASSPERAEAERAVVFLDAGADAFSVLAHALHDARRDTDDEPTWVDATLEDSVGTRPRAPAALASWMRESPERAALAMAELAASAHGPALFVIDRLEALVSERASDEARAFSAALTALARSSDEHVRVVATVDEDALGRLPTTLFAHASVMRLEPPDAEELRAIALEALAEVGAVVSDPDALDEVTEHLAHDARGLALLRFVLLDAWRRRDPTSGQVSFEPFRGTGTTSVLARFADATFDAIPERDRPAARELLVRLAVDARASSGSGGPLDPEAEALLEGLVRGGLVRRDVDGRAELAHPSLPTAWRRLARWITEHDGDAWVVREAIEGHRRWVERGRSDDDLLRGRVLHAARLVVERRLLPPEVVELVRASARVEDRTRARWRALRGAFVVAALLAVVGLGIAGWSSRRRAEDAERARATSERDRAELLARSARLHWESGDVRTARAQLRRSLEVSDTLAGRVLHAELAADPERWRMHHVGLAYDVALDEAGEVAFVAWQTGELSRFVLATGEERRVRASDDQLLCVVALGPNEVVAGDLAGGLVRWTLEGDTWRSATIAHHPRGIRRLVRAGEGALVVSLLGGSVRYVALDGTPAIEGASADLNETAPGLVWEHAARVHAVTASGRVVRADLTTGEVVEIARVGAAQSMTRFGDRLAIGGEDGRLHVVDPRDGATTSRAVVRGRIRALAAVGDHELFVTSLDGELVVVSEDAVRALPTEEAPVVAFGAHRELAVLGLGNGARAFDWRAEPRPRVEGSEPVLNTALGPDALYWTSREVIVETDRYTGAERRRFVPFEGRREIRGLSVSPRGDRLAAWFGGLGVAIVEVSSGAPVALSFEGPSRVLGLRHHRDGVVYGTSSGDLVELGWDGTTRRRALGAGTIVAVESLGEAREGSATSAAIASAHTDGRVLRTDDVGSRELHRFPLAAAGLFAQGQRLHVLLDDGSLHRVDSGVVTALPTAGARVYRGALASDGSRLVAPGADGALHVWSLGEVAHHALPLSGRELNVVSLDEEGVHAAVGGDDGIVRFVDVRDGSSPWARDPASTAFTSVLDDELGRWRGDRDGTLVREIAGREERSPSVVSLPIVHLAFAPHDVLVIVQAAGHVELRHRTSRERVGRARLRGEIVHVEIDGERVRVRADTGQSVELDLRHLGAPRCELLRASWASSPLTWSEGEARVEGPPADHECATD